MTAGYQIPITYVVNATVVTPSQGLEPLKLSTILIMTDEEPAIPYQGSYVISRTSTGIANQWGTNTEIAQQANMIYSQTPNILTNNGYIIGANYQTVDYNNPATAGTLTTENLSANIKNFISVTNGVINLTVDGSAKQVTGLDFSEAATLEEIAEVIQAKYTDITITATADNTLLFVSKTTGAASNVTIAAMTGSSGTDLYGASYLNGAAATAVSGEAAESGTRPETLSEAVTRLAGQIYFEGILTTRTLSDEEAITACSTIQGMQNRIFPVLASNASALAASTGLFSRIMSYTNCKPLLYTLGDDDEAAALNSRLFAAGYLSRGFAINYSGSNTTITMNLKDLTGLQADTNINETILAQAAAVGADCFVSLEGLPKVISNKQNGMYFDQVTNRIWLVNTIQREVFNVLATTRTKVPQTDAGLESIVKAIRNVCNQAVVNGMLAPGEWNSSDFFGNQEDFLRNIREFGYYIYHQPVAEQAQSEREERRAPQFMVACKESGAVHSASIVIYIEA